MFWRDAWRAVARDLGGVVRAYEPPHPDRSLMLTAVVDEVAVTALSGHRDHPDALIYARTPGLRGMERLDDWLDDRARQEIRAAAPARFSLEAGRIVHRITGLVEEPKVLTRALRRVATVATCGRRRRAEWERAAMELAARVRGGPEWGLGDAAHGAHEPCWIDLGVRGVPVRIDARRQRVGSAVGPLLLTRAIASRSAMVTDEFELFDGDVATWPYEPLAALPSFSWRGTEPARMERRFDADVRERVLTVEPVAIVGTAQTIEVLVEGFVASAPRLGAMAALAECLATEIEAPSTGPYR